MNIYQSLFADQLLEDIIQECDFPQGSRLSVARARMWEGNASEAATISVGGEEPWATFINACARIRGGLSAKHLLLPIAEDAHRESRVRLWAWTALRRIGEKPSPVFAGEALGFVLEVPMEGKMDVLAVYADGGARFLGFAEQLIVREPGQPSAAASKVILEAMQLLAIPAAVRDPDRPPPPPERVRMTTLSADGLHTIEVPWSDVEAGGRYEGIFIASTKLLDEVTSA